MRQYNRRVLMVALAAAVMLWLVVNLPMLTFNDRVMLLTNLTLISLWVGWIVDLASVAFGINSMRMLRTVGYDALLRTTTLEPQHLITTRYHVALVYAWRGAWGLMAVRAALVLNWLFLGVIWFDGFLNWVSVDGNRRILSAPYPYNITLERVVFTLVFGIMVAWVLIYDPLWRMRASAALGIQIAARLSNQWTVIVQVIWGLLTHYILIGVGLLAALFVGVAITGIIGGFVAIMAAILPEQSVYVVFAALGGGLGILIPMILFYINRRLMEDGSLLNAMLWLYLNDEQVT